MATVVCVWLRAISSGTAEGDDGDVVFDVARCHRRPDSGRRCLAAVYDPALERLAAIDADLEHWRPGATREVDSPAAMAYGERVAGLDALRPGANETDRIVDEVKSAFGPNHALLDELADHVPSDAPSKSGGNIKS